MRGDKNKRPGEPVRRPSSRARRRVQCDNRRRTASLRGTITRARPRPPRRISSTRCPPPRSPLDLPCGPPDDVSAARRRVATTSAAEAGEEISHVPCARVFFFPQGFSFRFYAARVRLAGISRARTDRRRDFRAVLRNHVRAGNSPRDRSRIRHDRPCKTRARARDRLTTSRRFGTTRARTTAGGPTFFNGFAVGEKKNPRRWPY